MGQVVDPLRSLMPQSMATPAETQMGGRVDSRVDLLYGHLCVA